MSLMRWFRKNNKKVMAIVVVIIMVGFIGGDYVRRLGQRRQGLQKPVAYWGLDTKITILIKAFSLFHPRQNGSEQQQTITRRRCPLL